jgi:type II secretory pathway component PulF
MFATLIPPAPLADWCKMLRHQLAAGLSPTHVLTSLSASGPAVLRPLSARLLQDIKKGKSFGDALAAESDILPALVPPLIHVGDETGHLPEVLAELEDYLREDDRLRRDFRQQTLMPRIQLFAAIFIVAGLIAILGIIAGARGGKPMTIFGLSGTTGALIFLAATLGPLFAFWMWSKTVAGTNAGRGRLRGVAARLPVVGPCLQMLMLSRFATALQLTLNSSLSPARAVRLSAAAAGDPGLVESSQAALDAIKKGDPLHAALGYCPQLPPEFVQMIAVAEEGGTIPEMMKHQARHYRELGRERMRSVSVVASMAIWILVAAFIIFMIFRIFTSTYLDLLKV